jgi:hypothetical protein
MSMPFRGPDFAILASFEPALSAVATAHPPCSRAAG